MTCKKVKYTSRKEAKRAMKLVNRSLHTGLENVYYCEVCTSWHTTTWTKNQYKKRKRRNRFKSKEDPEVIRLREEVMKNG